MNELNSSNNYLGGELELFKNARNWKNYFSSQIAKYISGNVLEIGAGIGANTPYLFQKSSAVSGWTCVEPDKLLCDQISTSAQNVAQLKVVNGTIDNVLGQTFDTVIYIDVLEHIEFPTEEVNKIKQVLNDKGKLIILVPAFNSLYSTFDAKIGHFKRYNKRTLLEDVNQQISCLDLFYLDSIGVMASFANKYFLKKELPTKQDVQLWDNMIIPISRISDQLFKPFFGKSLIGIFQK